MGKHKYKLLCPCGSTEHYDHCCGVFVSGQLYPDTPEQLMRSRYTAFTQANTDYIMQTMQGPAAEDFDPHKTKQWAESMQWIRLNVLHSEMASNNDIGYVEFIAYFREAGGPAQKIHERSEFHRIDGHWYYWDGRRF